MASIECLQVSFVVKGGELREKTLFRELWMLDEAEGNPDGTWKLVGED
jgi:hypothetical protein